MNYMNKVADMLGMRFGEAFEIEQYPDARFKFTEKGLIAMPKWAKNEFNDSDTLLGLLSGELKIIFRAWVPKGNEPFYYWHNNNGVWMMGATECHGWVYELGLIAMGNCFITEADAEAHKDEVISRYEAIRKAVAESN